MYVELLERERLNTSVLRAPSVHKILFFRVPSPPTTMMMLMRLLPLIGVSLIVLTQGQQYQEYADQEYANDNLYHDYAMRQQEKDVGKS